MITRIILIISLLTALPNVEASNSDAITCMVYQCGDTLVINPIVEGTYHESSINWYDAIRKYHEQGFDVFVDAYNTMVDNAPISLIATLGEDTIEYVKNIPDEDCDISSARIRSNRLSIYNMTVGMSVKDALSFFGICSYNKGIKAILIPGLLSPRKKHNSKAKCKQHNAVLSLPPLQSDVYVMVENGIITEISISEDDNE